MSNSDQVRAALQEIPSVDDILTHFQNEITSAPYSLYLKTIRFVLDDVRREIKNYHPIKDISDYTIRRVETALGKVSSQSLEQGINGTGIILHTGLGRAPLSTKLVQDALNNVVPYANLELDLPSGKRGERTQHVESLINVLCGSEAALVVNNNAAAVLLMLNALAEGKEVIISRGEQVEIGGSFRIPDVIKKSDCIMVEVGTTNKTHLQDYENEITPNTGAILVAHTSNYKVMGFTESVDLTALSALAKKKKIPLILDLGSGAIADFQKLGLANEPTVQNYLKSGASVVSFSGDKLLGGPQAGIICGKKTLIRKIHKNPLYRALRCDKFTYAILEATLRTYLTPIDIQKENLTMTLFNRSQAELLKIGKKIVKKLPRKIVDKFGIEVEQTEVEAGSGSLPLEKFPSAAFVFNGEMKASELSRKFRSAPNPVLGYISGNRFLIDLKAIPATQEKQLLSSLISILQ